MRRQLAVFAICAVAFGAVKQFKPGWNIFSIDQDIQLGMEAAAQLEKQYPIVDDAQVQAYAAEIGGVLAAQPQAGKFPYTFKVIADDNVNAFALPGGPTFVYTGLILAVENEAQLAGVIAHEISHCALRHGTNQASKARLLQLPAALAGGMLGQLSQAGIGLGLNGVLLKYSRNAESDADLNGAQMMAAAGYNPLEMARFFEKLEASPRPAFLSSHPNPGNRTKAIERQLQDMPRRDYAANTGKFAAMQSRVSRIPAPATADGKR
jgi:beta-barrel assembly-enhancing protease